MSQPIILKVYGNISPVSAAMAAKLKCICAGAIGTNGEIVSWEAGLARITFEGIYFPVEEILALLKNNLQAGQSGKLDVLDLENWTLTRHRFEEGRVISRSVPLNDVLAYSGH